MDVEDLNACLRGEISAIETYRQALEKLRADYADDARFGQLGAMLADHEDAAGRLRKLIQAAGGTPDDDSGAWGTWSKTVMGAAKLLGDKAALKALKEGEEDGQKQYERLSHESGASADVRSTASALLTRNREHIRVLDALIDAA